MYVVLTQVLLINAVQYNNLTITNRESEISLFHSLLSVKPFCATQTGEDEMKGKLTTSAVAVEEWMVNSLADLKHNPRTPIGRLAIAMMEFVQKEISGTD